jgi:hypothetical protein
MPGRKLKRVSVAWAFWKGKPDSEDALFCLVCTKYSSYHSTHKHTSTYKEKSGTSGLRSHCEKYLPVLFAHLLTYVESVTGPTKKNNKTAAAIENYMLKPSAAVVKRHSALERSGNQMTQDSWIQRQILGFAKGYRPLAEVEDPFFCSQWYSCQPQLTIPSRRDFRLEHIRRCTKSESRYVLAVLEQADVIALTYDLWMTYGTANVFAINAHELSRRMVLEARYSLPWVGPNHQWCRQNDWTGNQSLPQEVFDHTLDFQKRSSEAIQMAAATSVRRPRFLSALRFLPSRPSLPNSAACTLTVESSGPPLRRRTPTLVSMASIWGGCTSE